MNKKKLATALFLTVLITGVVFSVRFSQGTPPPVLVEPAKVKGKTDAPHYIVVFSDFACPYCKEIRPNLDAILRAFPNDLKLLYKHFPLDMHEKAPYLAQASECAADQGKFWEMHDKIYDNNFTIFHLKGKALAAEMSAYAHDLGINVQTFDQCLESGVKKVIVDQNMQEAKNYMISGTPTPILDGTKILKGLHVGSPEPTIQLIESIIGKKREG